MYNLNSNKKIFVRNSKTEYFTEIFVKLTSQSYKRGLCFVKKIISIKLQNEWGVFFNSTKSFGEISSFIISSLFLHKDVINKVCEYVDSHVHPKYQQSTIVWRQLISNISFLQMEGVLPLSVSTRPFLLLHLCPNINNKRRVSTNDAESQMCQ